MAINKVMVLGAGTMGMGIAQVFAEAGKTVIVRDIADAFIQRGEGVLKKNMEKKVAKGKITEEELDEATFTFVKYYVQGEHYDELVEENKKLRYELEQEISWRNRTDS